jgi:hypothetical protein
MLYAGIAIIAAGIVAALLPILREWGEHRQRKEQEGREREGRDRK